MRPLYVRGRAEASLRADGASLVYRRPGQAAVRFPLERVSRVVVCGRAGIEEDVLRTCAVHGVIVALLDADGRPEGFLVPWRTRQLKPGQILEAFLHLRDSQWRFENWRRSEERRAIFKVLPEARNDPALRRADAARRHLEASLKDSRGKVLLEQWRPLLAAVVHSRLSAAGLILAPSAVRKPGMDLPAAFRELLEWYHFRYAQDCCAAPEAWFEVVSSYEQIRERDEQRASAMCSRFIAWIKEQAWE
ncbi:MAG: CRISPR-associated endonuclease Cas1 [Bryobacteraceae bacterium]